MATTTTTTASSDFYNRMQKRRHAELSLLRRPSETESQSTFNSSTDRHSSTTDQQSNTDTSPASPKSSHSIATSSVRSIDQYQALQQQLQQNNAQIEANEAKMRELLVFDSRMGEKISNRLSDVRHINESLRSIHDLLARVESISQELGIEKRH